jgi:hypothetical protein
VNAYFRQRLTIRRLMILVAVIGLALGGWIAAARWWDRQGRQWWQRRGEAQAEAARQAMDVRRWSNLIRNSRGQAAPVSVTRIPIRGLLRENLKAVGYDISRPYFYASYLGYNPNDALKYPPDPHLEEWLAVCRERAEYHDRMRRKWASYAWTPWVRFDPDPPMPPVGDPDVSQSY